MCQTLGVDAPPRNQMIRGTAASVAIILFIGFCSVPVAMLTNALSPPPTVEEVAVQALQPESEATSGLPLEGGQG